ncbi:MAG: methylamine utilization protein [Robiginitomaculum sp.]|nr:MAG: methylamine utilization protein [Robiginitomaculum sp.]
MIDRAKDGAFVVATANVGATGNIVVSASSSASPALPVSLLVCQTDPVSGACLATPATQTSLTIGAGDTPSFAFFTSSNTVWPYDPAANRINITFKEGGAIRGSTSVALRTLQGTPGLPSTTIDYEAIAANLPAHFTTAPANQGGGNGNGNGGGAMNSRYPLNEDNTPVGNPVTNAGATLGRVLFHDKRLSINDTISCSSCHEQSIGFSDPDVLSTGFVGGHTGRHSMGLANARFYAPGAFFWDERAATLEDQVLMPIQDGVEMGMTLSQLLPKLQAVDFYPALFSSAFGDDTITADRISRSLAQFVRSLVTTNSKFDQAYINGTVDNPDFAGTFTAEELLGKRLFMPSPGSGVQSLGCAACHGTTTQILSVAENNGLDANTDADQGVGNGRFKAPSLRNIAVRGPYMHDGRFSTLEEVVEFYNSGIQDHPDLSPHLREGGPGGPPRRMNMTTEEKAALVAFLKTLTDNGFLTDSRFSDPFNKR